MLTVGNKLWVYRKCRMGKRACSECDYRSRKEGSLTSFFPSHIGIACHASFCSLAPLQKSARRRHHGLARSGEVLLLSAQLGHAGLLSCSNRAVCRNQNPQFSARIEAAAAKRRRFAALRVRAYRRYRESAFSQPGGAARRRPQGSSSASELCVCAAAPSDATINPIFMNGKQLA